MFYYVSEGYGDIGERILCIATLECLVVILIVLLAIAAGSLVMCSHANNIHCIVSGTLLALKLF